jgi:hypothetical protein
MTDLPFNIYLEEGPGGPRLVVQFSRGSECKLSRDQAEELARHIRDAIEHGPQHDEPVRNHEGNKITVRRFEKMITVDFWFPTPTAPTTGHRLTVDQAKDFLHELVSFMEDVDRDFR